MKKLLALVTCLLFANAAFAQRGPLPPVTEVSRDTLMMLTTYETADGQIKTEKVLTVEIKMKQTTEYLVHFPVYFPESKVKWREPRKTYEK